MSHRHGKKDKEEKKSPLEERINTVEAIRRLYNLEAIIMCNLCEKKDTCVNRSLCTMYSDKPPNCPICKEPMDKIENTFVCTPCSIKAMKKKRMEEINNANMS